MQALRITQNVAQDGYLHIAVPPEMSRRCEVIVLPLEEHLEKRTYNTAKMQEQSGFVQMCLALIVRMCGMTCKGKIFKIPFPFTDLSGFKARPALAVSEPDEYGDLEFLFITTKQVRSFGKTLELSSDVFVANLCHLIRCCI